MSDIEEAKDSCWIKLQFCYVYILARICWWYSCPMRAKERLCHVKWKGFNWRTVRAVYQSTVWEVYIRIDRITSWFVHIYLRMSYQDEPIVVCNMVRFADAAMVIAISHCLPNAIFHSWKSNRALSLPHHSFAFWYGKRNFIFVTETRVHRISFSAICSVQKLVSPNGMKILRQNIIPLTGFISFKQWIWSNILYTDTWIYCLTLSSILNGGFSCFWQELKRILKQIKCDILSQKKKKTKKKHTRSQKETLYLCSNRYKSCTNKM